MDYLLFGAGKICSLFIKSESYKNIRKEDNRIYIYDNNKSLPPNISGIKRIDHLEVVDKNTQVIITCGAITDVHIQCNGCNLYNIFVFDYKYDQIIAIKEYYRNKQLKYRNYKRYCYDIQKRINEDEALENFLMTKDLYSNITEVAFMLSNLCNYAFLHKRCPASCISEKEILPSKVVFRVLDELSSNGFMGTLCFHIYNEPLIDPRLFMFIQYAKNKMPNCTVRIYSNGYYLNNNMVRELEEVGVDVLETTAYGAQEYERLIDLDINIAFSTFMGNLDNRLDYYSKPNCTNIISDEKCFSLLSQIPIFSDGSIGTCCLDYMHPYELGNVVEHTLKHCLSQKRVIEFQTRLAKGERGMFSLCENCNWKRGRM